MIQNDNEYGRAYSTSTSSLLNTCLVIGKGIRPALLSIGPNENGRFFAQQTKTNRLLDGKGKSSIIICVCSFIMGSILNLNY